MEIKNDRLTLLRELLVTQMNHWMLFPLYIMLLIEINNLTGSGTPRIWSWILLSVLPFLFYLGRTMFKKFYSMVLLYAGVFFLMFILPIESTPVRAIYLSFVIFYVAYSWYLWSTSKDGQDVKFHPAFAVLLSVFMYFFLHYRGVTKWDIAYITVLIVVIALYFVIYYIERYQEFLTINSISAGHIPSAEMFRSGMGLVIGYTGIGILILICVSNLNWLKSVLNAIKNMIYVVLRFLFSLLTQNEQFPLEEVEVEGMAAVPDVPATEPLKTFWLWEVLEYALIIFSIFLLAFAVIKVIMALVNFIRNRLNNISHNTTSYSVESVLDVREKCDITKKNNWKMKLPFLALSPKERIRQMYRKCLIASSAVFTKGDDLTILNKYTARESGQILERESLAHVYEKARYSNEECDGEDVRRMRNACK